MSAQKSNSQDTLRVLVVEDDALLAMEMEDMLRDLGCDVVGPVARLDKALDVARAEALDGAVLDLNLRGELSFPVIDLLKGRGVPVIVCSGYADLPDMRERLEGIPFLAKPYDAAAVAKQVQEDFLSVQRAAQKVG